jgi:hypothetical protein
MAGDWIKWTKGLAKRREVIVIASRLQKTRQEIAGRLMELWEWCDDNICVSDVPDMSLDVSLILGDKPFDFVDALLGLPGMAEAMSSPEVKWLDCRSGGRIVFPNLARHNGTSAKTRAYETSKKQKQRQEKVNVPGNVPKVSPKTRDKTGTREEKRREVDTTILDLPIPEHLQTDDFADAWMLWITHRKEIKKALTPSQASQQIAKFSKWGVERSVIAIRHTVAGGWVGILEPGETASQKPKPDLFGNFKEFAEGGNDD